MTSITVQRGQTWKSDASELSLVTTTVQPLLKPAQPQSEQRHLIPGDSFFLFVPRLSGKTIFSESHSGQQSILRGMKVVSTGSKRFAT
jgi:hypothetical protein